MKLKKELITLMIINLVLIKFPNTFKNLFMKKNIEKSSKVNIKSIIKN